MKKKYDTAVERAIHRAELEEERRIRNAELDAKRDAGVLKSPSDNRKRKKHGRR